jgi:hypothetical protein
MSGPATGLVITSTPTGRFVYWPERKPADLTDGNSRCVAYLDSLPFQEGTPLAPTEEHTSTEVATTDSGLGTDRQVFMAASETPGPSGTRPDRYLDDISEDELFAKEPADEPMTTRTPDVNAIGSETNGADISVRLSQSRIFLRLLTKSPTGYTPPRTVPHVYHYDRTSGSGDTRGRSHRQASRKRLLHED